jgi:hypothetical protein
MKNKNISAIVVLLILANCSVLHDNNSGISIQSHTIDDGSKLTYSITNHSRDDIFIFNLEDKIYPRVFVKESKDSIWSDWSLQFQYSSVVLPVKPEMHEIHEEGPRYKPNSLYPELTNFYNKVNKIIDSSKLSFQSEYLFFFDELVSSSIFLKQGESYFDTINIAPFKKKYPNIEFKFVFSYPSDYSMKSDTSFLEFFINSILRDSLGVAFPKKLDGYKIIYKEKLFHQAIIN